MDNEVGGHVECMGEESDKVVLVKPEGKRPLGRPSRRWEDGTRMDLRRLVRGVWSEFSWLKVGTSDGIL
jgi:hypothetical protein